MGEGRRSRRQAEDVEGWRGTRGWPGPAFTLLTRRACDWLQRASDASAALFSLSQSLTHRCDNASAAARSSFARIPPSARPHLPHMSGPRAKWVRALQSQVWPSGCRVAQGSCFSPVLVFSGDQRPHGTRVTAMRQPKAKNPVQKPTVNFKTCVRCPRLAACGLAPRPRSAVSLIGTMDTGTIRQAAKDKGALLCSSGHGSRGNHRID